MGRKSKKTKNKESKKAGAKAKGSQGNSRRILAEHLEARESPNAVAGTVAWLLSALATGLGLVAVVIALLIYRKNGKPETLAVAYMMLFSAFVTGMVTLVLTLLVHRTRRTAPPRNVTIGVITIGLVPLLVYGLLWMKG